jgi:HAD superfamily hydrolase (TIGR01509 family)
VGRWQALVFDFDGTLVDTETPWYQAAQEVYAEHGATLAFEAWARGIGTAAHAFDPWAHLQDQLGRPVDRALVRARYEARVRALVAEAPLRPGVARLLAEAARRGLRLGLASSSPRAWVLGHLERLGLTGWFAAVCTQDDVERVKPAPDLYLLALRRLGVAAEEALAVEDSPNGVRAAVAAGIRCVYVPNATTAALPAPEAALVLASFEEADLRAWERLLEGGAG